MIYQYRWLSFIILNFIFILLEYGYIISPSINDMISAQTKEKQLVSRINQVNRDKSRHFQVLHSKSNNSPPQKLLLNDAQNDFDHIVDLVTLLQLNGIKIQSIKLVSFGKRTERKQLHVIFQSQFDSFLSFLSSLTLNPYPMLILDYSCKIIKQNQLLITMSILLVKKFTPEFFVSLSSLQKALKPQNHALHSRFFCPESGFNKNN